MNSNAKYLTHPNIPKPLHGVNPRSILGQDWWDIERKKAYAKKDFHCWACGIHKSQDKYHNWLEAHEHYNINYKTGEVKLIEIIALCHCCHNFIHSGRLFKLYKSDEIEYDKIMYILKRGFKILKENNLKPFYGTAIKYLQLQGYKELEAIYILDKKNLIPDNSSIAEWSEWKLVLDGKEYYSKFESIEGWQEYYN